MEDWPYRQVALEPPDHGVLITGTYIIDDDGIQIFAGPFELETAAIGWINQRQEDYANHREAGARAAQNDT